MTQEFPDRREFFHRCRRLVIKVGSAVLTGPKGLDRVMVHRLSDQIAELRGRNGDVRVSVVSSGAVACGVRKIGLSERPRAIPQKQAAAAVGQSVLMEAWEAAFDKYDLMVAQVLLTGEDLAHRHRYLNARNTLETLMDWGILPVINENDTVAVEEIKFGDNDQLSAMIAGLIGADLVVCLTDTDGLYDCDPRTNPQARLIPVVRRVDSKLLACAAPEPGSVGTGGMLSKIAAARKCLSSGIPMVIAPGKERDILLRLFDGEPLGTVFLPRQRVYQGRKIWLANLPKPAGDLVLDGGAAMALRRSGRSLLPIGIREVRGAFGVGAAVRCLDEDGNVIGIGLSNYKSSEVEQIMGHHTEEIEDLIGYKHSDEVIHRNNFALMDEIMEESEGEPDA
ncbi:MAG: glutamate 5-kinase [Syntrophobacteraceae bacterium]|nr:glutamate 5-kinase [Desulfobacteraceae bacterium]